MKILRIIFFYCLFWMVALIAGLGFSTENIGAYMAFTFLAPALGVWLMERRISRKRQKKQESAEAEVFVTRIESDKLAIREQVERHLPALSRNMRKAIKINDYGATASDKRYVVVAEFLNSTGVELRQMSLMHAVSYISTLLEAEENVRRGETKFDVRSIPLNGYEFEYWVAEGLERFGWKTRVTQGSGDQGVDVIAEIDGVSVGFQCKLYSGSVGNKAVQEAYSGMKHFGLDKAAVLTNADFTKSAKELAVSTGVLLLSPDDIPTLSERPELNSQSEI